MESRFGMYFLANLQMVIYMNWPSEIVFFMLYAGVFQFRI